MSDPHGQVAPANPDVQHEHSDVNVRAILGFAVGLIVMGIAAHLACWGLFDYFFVREARIKESPFPLAAAERDKLPPPPILEGIQREEGEVSVVRPRQLRPAEQSNLQSYGWVDGKAGIVRIPIQEAMEVIVQRSQRPEPQTKEKP